MTDIATITTRIDEIDTLLAGGVEETRYGDRMVKRDLESLRQERARLQRELSARTTGASFRRVVFRG